MREFWAVVGKILVDEDFYRKKLFPLCGYNKKFEELDDLRRYLIKDLQLGFSRWEVMKINTIATEQVKGNDLVRVDSADQEASIAEVQKGWVDAPPDLKSQFELCSVIGLAAMDINFRKYLHDASREAPEDIAALKKFLEESEGDTPIFKLPDGDLKILNRFLRSLIDSLVEAMKVFHYTNWVQPNKYPCDGGVTKTVVIEVVGGAPKPVTVPYEHFSQNGLNLLLEKQPEKVKDDLKDARAIL